MKKINGQEYPGWIRKKEFANMGCIERIYQNAYSKNYIEMNYCEELRYASIEDGLTIDFNNLI